VSDNLVRTLVRGVAAAVGGHGTVLLDQLATEVFPQFSEELLPEWEALLEIVPPAAATTDERRAALLTKWRGGVSLSVSDLKKVLAPILGQDEADVDAREADPALASGTCGAFTAFVFRDPTLPGSCNVREAQRAADRLKSAHVRILVGESIDFLTNDPLSLTNRDLLGA
jgi:hypothetical protein